MVKQNLGEISCKLKFQVKLKCIWLEKKNYQTAENCKLVKLDKLVKAVTECKILRATIECTNKRDCKTCIYK